MMKKKVAFICVNNSCRSQIAEGWAKALGKDILEVYSAGTEPSAQINPLAVQAMKAAGIDISRQYPKDLQSIPNEVDILVTMGCNVICPYIPCKQKEDWGIEDPSGGSIEDYIKVRDIIKEKVEDLIARVKAADV